MVDTKQQCGQVKTSLASLAKARADKELISSKNLYYVLNKRSKLFDIKTAILHAIRHNATDYNNPPINNLGYNGILKTSKKVYKWFDTPNDIEEDFSASAMMMEKEE